MRQAFEDVEKFMIVGGQFTLRRPVGRIDPEVALRRLRFITSEVAELAEAMQKDDMVETADALADICYVVIGTACALGIPLPEVWDAVQAANMAKFPPCENCGGRGVYSDEADCDLPENALECASCGGKGRRVPTDGAGKIIKPPGWEPPDIGSVLRASQAEVTTERPVSPVNPAHYRQEGKAECIDALREKFQREHGAMGGVMFVGFCLGNAFKYRWRAGQKGEAAEDEAKACWYEQMAAHVVEGKPDPRASRESR